MAMLIKDRLAFLNQLQEKKENREINELNKGYIDRFVSNNYGDLITDLKRMSGIITNAMDVSDRLNNIILDVYHDNSVRFYNQTECDSYVISILKKKGLF